MQSRPRRPAHALLQLPQYAFYYARVPSLDRAFSSTKQCADSDIIGECPSEARQVALEVFRKVVVHLYRFDVARSPRQELVPCLRSTQKGGPPALVSSALIAGRQ